MGSPGALARQAPPPRAPLPPPGSTPPASRTPRGTWPRRWRRTWRGRPKRRCWPTRCLSCQEPASRMQSRIAARPPPLEDLAYGPDQAPGHRIRTNSLPEAPRSRGACRKPSHESCDSVSTTDTPSTCLQPDSSQPIAVTAAVEAARPPQRHLK